VSRRGSPVRLVVALSVAAALSIFLIYASLAGGTPSLRPSQLPGHHGKVSLAGQVVGPITGDAHAGGLHFTLRDVKGSAAIPVVFHGSVPDLFRKGRDVVAVGKVRQGVFLATDLSTKCPSKYQPKKP
jgi:cytochrome c-type biogenesis protein CcmE